MAITVPTAGTPITAAWGESVADLLNDATAIGSASASITNTQTKVHSLLIPANTLVAGMGYRIIAAGVITSSAANAVTFRARVNTDDGATTGVIPSSNAPNATTTASGDGWRWDCIVTCRSTGGSGTVIGHSTILGGPTQPFSNPTGVASITATVSVDTTVDNYLVFTIVTGAGTTAVVCHQCFIERLTA